jgi:hypothetical protein
MVHKLALLFMFFATAQALLPGPVVCGFYLYRRGWKERCSRSENMASWDGGNVVVFGQKPSGIEACGT